MSGFLTIPLSDTCRALKGYVAQMQSEKNSPEVLINNFHGPHRFDRVL